MLLIVLTIAAAGLWLCLCCTWLPDLLWGLELGLMVYAAAWLLLDLWRRMG